jgi:ribosomal protein L17
MAMAMEMVIENCRVRLNVDMIYIMLKYMTTRVTAPETIKVTKGRSKNKVSKHTRTIITAKKQHKSNNSTQTYTH